MRTRDPEAKRHQLLEAALAEFAEHGIAGARIDAIARRAGVSAGHVYSFYEGKEGLFEAVFDAIVERAMAEVPFDADDLAGYAGRLIDANARYPEVNRFMTWYQLERGRNAAPRQAVTAAMRTKVAAIEDAQRRGVVTDRCSAGEVLALVLALAGMWSDQTEDARSLVAARRRRAAVVDAVRLLVAP